MIIWTGWGVVALLVYAGVFAASEWALKSFTQFPDAWRTQHGVLVMSLIVGGIINGLLGAKMNRDRNDHTIFFIPVQYVGIIMVIFGTVAIFV
jgi:hypothetical protein